MTGVLTTNELKSYAKAGAVAEEVFTAIRTVFAFNGQYKECDRYDSRLDDAKKYGIRKGFINGAMMGFLWLVVNGAYALGNFEPSSKIYAPDHRYDSKLLLKDFGTAGL